MKPSIEEQIAAVQEEIARLDKGIPQAETYDPRSVLRLTLRRNEWIAILATLSQHERAMKLAAVVRDRFKHWDLQYEEELEAALAALDTAETEKR